MASKRKRRQKKAHPESAVDVLEPPKYRHFREALGIQEFIAPLSQASSPDECGQELAKLVKRRSAFERDIISYRETLLKLLSSEDGLSILALASLGYAYQDPNIMKESENDRHPAHLEYLGLQGLDLGLEVAEARHSSPHIAHLTFRALRLVRHIFGRRHLLLEIDAFTSVADGEDRATIEYQRSTQLNSMHVRIHSFARYTREITLRCFEPFDNECQQILGFTARDTLAVSDSLLESRLLPRAEILDEVASIRNNLQRQYTSANEGDRTTGLPAWILRLPLYDTRLALDLLAWSEFDGTTLATFSSAEMADAARIPEQTANSILAAFSASQRDFVVDHHAYPTGAHPLTTAPFLKCSDRYIVLAPQVILDAIRPRMETLIQSSNPSLWQQYTDHRAKYLEQQSTDLLATSLSGSSSWERVEWRSDEAAGELDGLVHCGDVCLQIQCRSGRVSAAARRGSHRHMASDVKKLISKATDQHQALMKARQTVPPTELGLTSAQVAALQAPLQFQVVVTLDDMDVWATLASRLKTIGRLPTDREIPWVLSLADLMVVVDMLTDAELVDYLVRRQRLERDGRIISHDEQDWLGHYITDALCFGSLPEFSGRERPALLPTQSEQFDAWYSYDEGRRIIPTKKPSQFIPTPLRRLLSRLQSEQPDHWILASVVLLDGDRAAKIKLSEQIRAIELEAQSGEDCSADRLLDDVGLTYSINRQLSRSCSREKARQHSSEMDDDTAASLWFFIGEDSDS